MRDWPVGYLHIVEELNSEPPKTNPSSGREEDWSPGPPDYKSSALLLGHARLQARNGVRMSEEMVINGKVS